MGGSTLLGEGLSVAADPSPCCLLGRKSFIALDTIFLAMETP
jgi:hypothetical protein